MHFKVLLSTLLSFKLSKSHWPTLSLVRLISDYHYASELVATIPEFDDFCIGGACYPEGHPDAATKQADICNLKKKVDAGCDFLTTQMFFDNNIFYNFLFHAREAGITVPIIPGIMPITRATQVKNAVKLSGCHMPERFINIVDHFGSDKAAMQQAGNVPPNPSELLITPQMSNLLEKLSVYYDTIIIDAPPCELVTDATIISRMVDSTVIVTSYKQTKKANLQKTIKSIKNVGGNIAGIVLNKIPVDAKKYQKSYYYGSQIAPSTKTKGRNTFLINEVENVDKTKKEIEK